MSINVLHQPSPAFMLGCEEYTQLGSLSTKTDKLRKVSQSYFRQNKTPNSMTWLTDCIASYLYDPLGRYIASKELVWGPLDMGGLVLNGVASDLVGTSVRGPSITKDLPAVIHQNKAIHLFLDHVRTMFSGTWDFGVTPLRSERHRENDVLHFNGYGEVRETAPGAYLRSADYANLATVPDALRVNGITYDWSYQGTKTWAPQVTGFLTREGIEAEFGIAGYPASSWPLDQYHYCGYANLEIDTDSFGTITRIAYDLYVVRNIVGTWVYDYHAHYRVTWTHTFALKVPVPLNQNFTANSVFNLKRNITWECIDAYVVFFTEGKGYPLGQPIPISQFVGNKTTSYISDSWTGRSSCAGLNYPEQPNRVYALIGYNPVTEVYTNTPHSMLHFRQVTYGLISDILHQAYFAADDALKSHLEFLESNHIEAAAELDSLFGLVSVPGLLKSLPTLIKRGNKRLLKLDIRKLVTILSDATLIYSFAIAPSYSDAKDVAARASMFLEKYRNIPLFAEQTIRGTSTLDLPDGLTSMFPGMKVKTRVKMRLGLNHLSLFMRMAPYDAAGIFPTLSRIWDLVPYSFLYDSFTGWGKTQDILESEMRLIAVDVDYTQISHNVFWNIPDSLMTEYGFHGIPASGLAINGNVGYNMYMRYLVKGSPHMMPTRAPIIQGLPNWITTGALIVRRF